MRLVEKADAGRRKEKGVSRLDQLRDLGITPGRTPTPRFVSAPKRGCDDSSCTKAGGEYCDAQDERAMFSVRVRKSTETRWMRYAEAKAADVIETEMPCSRVYVTLCMLYEHLLMLR